MGPLKHNEIFDYSRHYWTIWLEPYLKLLRVLVVAVGSSEVCELGGIQPGEHISTTDCIEQTSTRVGGFAK